MEVEGADYVTSVQLLWMGLGSWEKKKAIKAIISRSTIFLCNIVILKHINYMHSWV